MWSTLLLLILTALVTSGEYVVSSSVTEPGHEEQFNNNYYILLCKIISPSAAQVSRSLIKMLVRLAKFPCNKMFNGRTGLLDLQVRLGVGVYRTFLH